MTMVLVHIESDGTEDFALYSSPIAPGAKVRFDSGYSEEVKAVFPGKNPFDDDVTIGPNQTRRVVVRANALAGHYPFHIENLEGEVLHPNLRIAVGESAVDGVGFRFDTSPFVTYLVTFKPRQEPVQVRVDNSVGSSRSVDLTDHTPLPEPVTTSQTIPQETTYLHPQAVDVSSQTPKDVRFSVALQPVPANERSAVSNVGQGGGTQQVDIVVDPDT